MIPIQRGPEPDELREARWWRLARLKLKLDESNDHQKTLTKATITGYDTGGVRAQLRKAQHLKCAYCERWHEEIAQPIEHFRPKKGAIRADNTEDQLHYWWLAWTWENLFFSCITCNCATYKGNRFYLEAGTPPLPSLSTDTSVERALLLDPAREQPMEHIQFRQDALGRWAPFPRNNSPQGATTIRVLGLDRPDLLDLYNQHVSKQIDPHLTHIENAIALGDAEAIRDAWRRRVAALLGHPREGWITKPFAALTWDVLDQRFPAAERERWVIKLPRPGKNLSPDPLPIELRPDLTSRFKVETIWYIRAIGPPTTGYKSHLQRALLAILRDPGGGPMSAGDLKAIIDSPFIYPLKSIEEALTAMKNSGYIQQLGASWSAPARS